VDGPHSKCIWRVDDVPFVSKSNELGLGRLFVSDQRSAILRRVNEGRYSSVEKLIGELRRPMSSRDVGGLGRSGCLGTIDPTLVHTREDHLDHSNVYK